MKVTKRPTEQAHLVLGLAALLLPIVAALAIFPFWRLMGWAIALWR